MLDTADSPLITSINQKVLKLFDALDKDVLQKFLSMLLFLYLLMIVGICFPCSWIDS